MFRTNALLVGTILLIGIPAAWAGDVAPVEIPTQLPNPFKPKEATKVVPITEDLKSLEIAFYGEANEDKPEDIRLSGLERTVFGVSGPYEKQALSTRTENLKKILGYMNDGRKWYADQKWQEAKSNFEEALRLSSKEWKSLVKAEIYYRIGMCEYEMSGIKGPKNPAVKTSGALLRSSRDNLGKAQEYYKSFKQFDTAQKIAAFLDSYKDKAATYFLY